MHYSPAEVLEIAQQIERNGARFYERAAETFRAPERRAMLLDLAAMERNHERTFAGMAARIAPDGAQEAHDPDGEAARYIQAAAGGQVFDLRADPVEWLGAGRSTEEIIRKAIELEKDSIVFYVGVKEAVPESLGRDWVDAIIAQEMGHVAQLTEMLSRLDQE